MNRALSMMADWLSMHAFTQTTYQYVQPER